MTNFQVYKKILFFAFIDFLIGLIMLGAVFGGGTAGFYIGQSIQSGGGFAGAIIGLLIGGILLGIAGNFLQYINKAAQISVIVKGVTGQEIPQRAFKFGYQSIKSRFGTLSVLFFVTHAIKAVFHQLSKAISGIGTMVGGDTGNAVGSAIDGVFQILISYLSDCCVGWVLYRDQQNPAKSACEGCAIFFKHGKTLLRNAGRIFGMGILSLIAIGGVFFAGFYALFAFPLRENIDILYAELAKQVEGGLGFSSNLFVIIFAAVVAFIVWGMVHSLFIHSFILVGVLRNFIASGQADIPTEEDYAAIEAKAPRFAKLVAKAKE